MIFQRHIMIECARYDKYRDPAPRSVDDAAIRRRAVRKGQPADVRDTRAINAHLHSHKTERQAQNQSTLFINPQQRRTLESVRQCRTRSPVTPVDVPSADCKPPLAKTSATGRDVSSDYEDMDISSDTQIKPVQPVRYATPAGSSTRDATPALSFISSDTESTVLDDDSDWQQPSSSTNCHDSASHAEFAQHISSSSAIDNIRVAASGGQALFYDSPEPSPKSQQMPWFATLSMPDSRPAEGLALELQYPDEENSESCPIRRFLDSLRRPVGHRYAAFYEIGIRSQEDVRALSNMAHEWDVVKAELAERGVTLMEWLYVKGGLEKIRHELAAGGLVRPKLEWEG